MKTTKTPTSNDDLLLQLDNWPSVVGTREATEVICRRAASKIRQLETELAEANETRLKMRNALHAAEAFCIENPGSGFPAQAIQDALHFENIHKDKLFQERDTLQSRVKELEQERDILKRIRTPDGHVAALVDMHEELKLATAQMAVMQNALTLARNFMADVGKQEGDFYFDAVIHALENKPSTIELK
jgi:uncharacterized protein YdcH (DUF465 family)